MNSPILQGPSLTKGKKRILVTGGTGFLGRALLQQLRQNHLHHVIPLALARPTSDLISLHRLLDYPCSHRTIFTAELLSLESLLEPISHADVVVHLAANMDFHPRDASKLISTNVEGTRNILEACRRVSQQRQSRIRFVYVSSTEAIGPTPWEGDGIFADEDAPRRPASVYAKSKVLAEDVVKEYSKEKWLNTIVARPTGVFGPGERFFFYEFMGLVATGLTIIAPSPMKGRVMFTHVDDVIQGLMICILHPEADGVYNVCPDAGATFIDIVNKLADELHYSRPIIYTSLGVGKWMIRIIAPIMNLGRRRVFTYHPQAVSETMECREYSNRKLKKLGFQVKYSVLEGVEQTIKHELETG